MQEHGVSYYCKIDVEGNDVLALESLKEKRITPRFISIESEKISWDKLLYEFMILGELGYSWYKIVDQQLIQLQKCPYPAREGQYCDHVFEEGSSGLFGDELPGRWLESSEAIERYKSIFHGYALNGDYGLLAPEGVLNFIGRVYSKVRHFKTPRNYINPVHILPPAGWYDTHAGL
jgi:hypothetical protein